jgi:REP element-mobilizing transposase RayT
MIYGYHLLWTAYGWWLPNDPRGSMSQRVLAENIIDLGELHYGRKKIQPAGWVLNQFREAAALVLRHEVLRFEAEQVAVIANAFSQVIRENTYTCYACAIMPEHIHLLIRKHRHQAEEMIENFQRESRLAVGRCERRDIEHPVWGGPGWKVYLDSVGDMRRIVRYIENNPLKIGLPRQQWDFVKPYDGWRPGNVSFAKPQARRRTNSRNQQAQ